MSYRASMWLRAILTTILWAVVWMCGAAAIERMRRVVVADGLSLWASVGSFAIDALLLVMAHVIVRYGEF